jgi:Family of unknown function (DUF5681)
MAADAFNTGYGKPPKHTRFRRGVSGNPKGRPKGTLNIATVMDRILRQKVLVTEDGGQKEVTRLEAVITHLANRALSGDNVAVRLFLTLAGSIGLEKQTVGPEQEMSDTDRKAMEQVISRLEQSIRQDHHEQDQ